MKPFALLVLCTTLAGCVAPADLRGTETVCPVHHVQLQEDTVRIGYGLPDRSRYSRGYPRAERDVFPYANTFIQGECSQMSDDPDRAHVRFCPECRRAREEWMLAHAGK